TAHGHRAIHADEEAVGIASRRIGNVAAGGHARDAAGVEILGEYPEVDDVAARADRERLRREDEARVALVGHADVAGAGDDSRGYVVRARVRAPGSRMSRHRAVETDERGSVTETRLASFVRYHALQRAERRRRRVDRRQEH